MKTDFKSRPAYVRTDNRIQAHFMTCFLSLILFRYLEKALDYKYTCEEILDTLREMDFLIAAGEGYIPTYTRTNLTDSLHEAFGFHTDYDIVSQKQMKKFLYVKYVLAIVILGLLGFCTIYFVGNRQVQKHLESVYSGELYQEATTIAQSHDVRYFQNDEERDNQLYENLCTLASYRHCDVWIISPRAKFC